MAAALVVWGAGLAYVAARLGQRVLAAVALAVAVVTAAMSLHTLVHAFDALPGATAAERQRALSDEIARAARWWATGALAMLVATVALAAVGWRRRRDPRRSR